jgi:hypothetical protein
LRQRRSRRGPLTGQSRDLDEQVLAQGAADAPVAPLDQVCPAVLDAAVGPSERWTWTPTPLTSSTAIATQALAVVQDVHEQGGVGLSDDGGGTGDGEGEERTAP